MYICMCNCSSQKPLLATGIQTRDFSVSSLDRRLLDQPAVYVCMNVCMYALKTTK
jgi:hypothetical protein